MGEILSPVENYTPIFVPAEKWLSKQILTAKYCNIVLFFPSLLNFLIWSQRNSPVIKTWEYQSPSSFSPLFLPHWLKKILSGLWEGDKFSFIPLKCLFWAYPSTEHIFDIFWREYWTKTHHTLFIFIGTYFPRSL